MTKHNQQGSVLVIVTVVLVVAVMAVLGSILWQNFLKPKTVTESSQINQTTTSTEDPYKVWKTYTSTAGNYQIKYPSTWLLIPETSSDGPYIRNFDPTTSTGGYPVGYIDVRVLKYDASAKITPDFTGTELYNQLGVSSVSWGPITYEPSTVEAYTVNGMIAKKTIASYDETTEEIFVLKNASLYEISLSPVDATKDTTVQKILSSFTLL